MSESYAAQQRRYWDQRLGRWRGHAQVNRELADFARANGCPRLAEGYEQASERWAAIEREHGAYDLSVPPPQDPNDTANLRVIAQMIYDAQTAPGPEYNPEPETSSEVAFELLS